MPWNCPPWINSPYCSCNFCEMWSTHDLKSVAKWAPLSGHSALALKRGRDKEKSHMFYFCGCMRALPEIWHRWFSQLQTSMARPRGCRFATVLIPSSNRLKSAKCATMTTCVSKWGSPNGLKRTTMIRGYEGNGVPHFDHFGIRNFKKSREDLNKVEVESSVRTKRPTSSKIDGNSWHRYVTK